MRRFYSATVPSEITLLSFSTHDEISRVIVQAVYLAKINRAAMPSNVVMRADALNGRNFSVKLEFHFKKRINMVHTSFNVNSCAS